MAARTVVVLPDMFRCFLVQEPRVNRNYRTAKLASEKWLTEKCSFSLKMQKRVNACDFSYFCSVAAPDAPKDRLQTMCDWGNWVFPFDDMFDSGHLRSDLETSRQVLNSLMSNMLGKSCYIGTKLPVFQAHDDVFRRLSACAPIGVQRRFAKSMELYAEGVARHVQTFTSHRLPSLQDMLQTRRLSVGVAPLYHLIEYTHSLQIPDDVFEDPAIQALERLGADLVILSNDILSYRKEESEGCPFNMVAACRMNGKSAQEAFDIVGSLLEESYIEWDEVMIRMPCWDVAVDSEVERYIKGIQNVVQANISWSFHSKRYLGADGPQVRKTWRIDVLVNPPYLSDSVGAEY
ncbi:terpene synthase metal binding domain-containing protein [Colletotrichum navitas]|uniref:Terpene synthase n=1 Tax=Colletotrichum navitas TaxID=681940 RepID=A0AAD8PYJ7_9PEZI|nr:terpene synthase metal binding domain-containing protein [Colletotrichum navitas]KAK1590316.1 terpene synthase metal binding domain-containing protein [Colletotrichum navitas]